MDWKKIPRHESLLHFCEVFCIWPTSKSGNLDRSFFCCSSGCAKLLPIKGIIKTDVETCTIAHSIQSSTLHKCYTIVANVFLHTCSLAHASHDRAPPYCTLCPHLTTPSTRLPSWWQRTDGMTFLRRDRLLQWKLNQTADGNSM